MLFTLFYSQRKLPTLQEPYYSESRVNCDKQAVEAFIRLAPSLDEASTDDDNNNALHIAGKKGLTALTRQIIDREYHSLLWKRNSEQKYPVQVCLAKKNYATAAVMLKAMSDW